MEDLPRLDLKRLFHCLIQPDGAETDLSQEMKCNLQSIEAAYPSAETSLLRNRDIRDFLAGHFDNDVLWAYDTLVPFAYKADLARYCLVYYYGGLYSDLSIRMMRNMNLTVWQGLGVYRDLLSFNRNTWATSIGLFCAVPGRAELKNAIENVVANCRNRYYGASPLEPTGPGLFGRAIAACNDTSSLWVGDVQMLSPEQEHINVAFIAPDNDIVAKLSKTEQGSSFSIPKANSYVELWCARKIFGE